MFGRVGHKVCVVVGVLMLLPWVLCAQQATKVKGRVTDSETGEGIPFAGVYFKGTAVGISTDLEGYYSIETRNPGSDVLCASILGYEAAEKVVHLESYQEVNFSLRLTNTALNAARVKPNNRLIRRLMDGIELNRSRNDPEHKEYYDCDIYNKMELDISNAEERIRNKKLRKNFGFIFDYMDTSAITGKAYLPVMISETISRKYHKSDPTVNREIIQANRISGINADNMLSQFTGSMHMQVNFYDNFISLFNIEIPSPLSPNGMVYYNYYVVDTLSIDGRKTYNVRFHPKKLVSSPVFDGEMNIDADDFALQKMHARLAKGTNVNWIRDLILDAEGQRISDTIWFYKRDNMYVDFALVQKDSSKLMSFLGNREMNYGEPNFEKPLKKGILASKEEVTIQQDAGSRDEAYWDSVRPYELSSREKNIYTMVDSIKTVPMYRNLYTLVSTFVTGYYDMNWFSMGPVYKFFSFNNLEGARFQFGGRTSAQFSKTFRIGAYGAYGTKDEKFKGGGSIEYLIAKRPTRKLTLSGKHDVIQLGKGSDAFSESNIMSSILSKGSQKLSPINEVAIQYEHEFTPGINSVLAVEHRSIYSNKYVPMLSPDSSVVRNVATNQAHLGLRFSWDETVTRGNFTKTYFYTAYPVITLDVIGAAKGISDNDFSYLRTEATMDYRIPIPPVGYSKIHLNVGKIFGRVPYPLLKLHEGNGTYFLDKSAFSCMDFYEFASDTWATLFYEHNFGGFFLGKIPLLRKMQLREVFSLKAAYGTLSKRNNGILGTEQSTSALMLFPLSMSSLNKPYVEMGLGITNILRLFRVDMFWRMTHRYHEVAGVREKVDNRFAVNLGLDIQF